MSIETKTKILDAAEQLFADHGFSATSIRAITRRAEVNLASLHYHFGSKEKLIEEVFARRLGPLNSERLRRLDSLEAAAGARGPEVEAILKAFLAPPLNLLESSREEGERFTRLMGRAFTEPGSFFQERITGQFSEVFARFSQALHEALPGLAPSDLFWRIHFIIGAMAHTLGHTVSNLCSSDSPEAQKGHLMVMQARNGADIDAEVILSHLITFAKAGLCAPRPRIEKESNET